MCIRDRLEFGWEYFSRTLLAKRINAKINNTTATRIYISSQNYFTAIPGTSAGGAPPLLLTHHTKPANAAKMTAKRYPALIFLYRSRYYRSGSFFTLLFRTSILLMRRSSASKICASLFGVFRLWSMVCISSVICHFAFGLRGTYSPSS